VFTLQLLGFSSWFDIPLSLEQRLEMIKQAGFNTTCIWFGDEEEMIRNGHADEIPDLVRNIGLYLDNVHAPFWNHYLLWSESSDVVAKIVKELEATLIFCEKHQIPRMVTHLATGKRLPPDSKRGLQLISDLVSKAETLGVTIAIENTESPEYLEYIFSDIQSPNLGFCYDSSHDFLPGQSKGGILERWGDLLLTTHLSDNHGINDEHLLPGMGTIDWPTIEKYIYKSGYQGALILEADGPNATKGFTPEEFLETGYQWVRQFGKMLSE